MKVTLIDHMGDDLRIVNAARVSFSKTSDWEVCMDSMDIRLSDADKSLIQFLARGCTGQDWQDLLNDIEAKGFHSGYHADKFSRKDMEELVKHVKDMPTHWTPFGHTAITLHIKAPIFISRQLGKHQTGLVWNEVSRRYVTDTPEFYFPEVWRKKADNVKQGSSDEEVDIELLYVHPKTHCEDSLALYNDMLDAGVCAEQARMVLPQNMYTEWYWTGNLYSFANLYIQRSDSHAQREVQEIAKQVDEVIAPLFPVSWEALTNG